MTAKDWKSRQLAEQNKLLTQYRDDMPQQEKDIWNLRWVRASIGYQSHWFRSGVYSSLTRAIDVLERDKIG